MTTINQTLHPEAGIVSKVWKRPPTTTSPLWVAAARPRLAPVSHRLALAGAMDNSHRRALTRAAGEAVERTAALARAGVANSSARSSGIAAHLTHDEATLTALMELIERDAVMMSWARQLKLALLPMSAWGNDARDVASRLEAQQIIVAQCWVPLRDVCVVVAAVFDARKQLCGFGAKAHRNRETAIRGAVFESIQLRELAESARDWDDIATSRLAVDDTQRARLWSTPEAYAHLRAWFATFEAVPLRARPTLTPQGQAAKPEYEHHDLIGQLSSLGLDVRVVDLTQLLPPAAVQLGWQVVDVSCDGLQPLVEDELHPGWLSARLDVATEWTGHSSPLPQGVVFPFPHPVL